MDQSNYPKLCYIEGRTAWFTTAPLVGEGKQWGDDWNDAPYEHNAGPPYEWRSERGTPEYTLMWGMFTGPLLEPADYHGGINSPWSIEMINEMRTPWLKTETYVPSDPNVRIYAGVTPVEFAAKVYDAGGSVWIPLKPPITRADSWLQEYERGV